MKSAINSTRDPAKNAGFFISGLKWAGLFLIALFAVAIMGTPTHAIPLLHATSQIQWLGMGITLGPNVLTLVDWAKRVDPDGKIAKIVEILNQQNEILEDMMWIEGNLPVGHRITQRTGLPAVAYRLLNQGVPPSKSTTAQIDEQCAKLEAWCEIDEEEAKLNGTTSDFRLSEAMAFLEAMNQQFASTLFYGNLGTAPEQFTGLAPRFSTISGATNAQNIINAGGAGGSCTSIWLVGWGPQGVVGIFPKGTQAGIQHRDLGLQVVETTAGIAGNRMMAYRDQWKWDVGIALKDWRYVIRIGNIKISTLVADSAGTTVKIIEYMAKAIDRIPYPGVVKMAFYCNRTVKSMLRIQALNKTTTALTITELLNQFGERIQTLTFLGVPVRTCDQILETEATIT